MTIEVTEQFTRRLADKVFWLTTASPAGQPSPRPVWFVFDGNSFLVFSQPDVAKVRHIEANPRVTVNFNSDSYGGDVLVIYGHAERDDSLSTLTAPGYLDKYEEHYEGIGFDRNTFDQAYSVGLRITPERSWGF